MVFEVYRNTKYPQIAVKVGAVVIASLGTH